MSSELSEIGFEYIKVCDEIKQANDALKQKKSKQKELKSKLLKVMAEKNIPELNLSNGTIHLDKKDSKESLNKKSISSSLKDYCKGNETEANRIAGEIMKNIPKKVVHKLRVDS